MTREHAKELLPIITAFANGETIQYCGSDIWEEVDDPGFDDELNCYRIAPKPRKVWVNEYPSGALTFYGSEVDANESATRFRIACYPLELPPLP